MMRIYNTLDPSKFEALCQRPVQDLSQQLDWAKNVFEQVRSEGDEALRSITEQIDGVALKQLFSKTSGFDDQVSDELKQAIQLAAQNIGKFHQAQLVQEPAVQVMPGVSCWRVNRAIPTVGLYIPGGTAPLFSTLLMLAIPAQLAGCENIVVVTPPQSDGSLNPTIGYTAQLLGIEKVFLMGGAQAIAALSLGTETVPKVDKIFGPGNSYVTAAKQYAQNFGTAMDMPAGPSELLVVAGKGSEPAFVAADLLSQAEHGTDSQVVVLSQDLSLMQAIQSELKKQLEVLPRKAIAAAALENSFGICFEQEDELFAFCNAYAPEHLILAGDLDPSVVLKIQNAGSIFLGNWSCETAGDYASGTNHTLPTAGAAKAYAGVSTDSFMKKITVQQISQKGLQNLGPSLIEMARAEGLEAHAQAVVQRLNRLGNEVV